MNSTGFMPLAAVCHHQSGTRMLNRLSSLSFLVLVSACSSSTPQSLVDARAAYQRAAQGPAAQLTPAQLHVAQTSLAVAEKTYDDEGDSKDARDRAYVAQRKAELAAVQANIVQADQRTAMAARQVQLARANNQAATRQELSSTRAQLAGEKNMVATQRAQLETERQRREAAEQRANDAISQLTSVASVKQESRGTVITLSGSVIFASGKAELLPAARAKLDQVAMALQQGEPDTRFVVEGYTDSRGSPEMNQELSNRRAAAVKEYLVSQGVSPDRISSRGMGERNPVADNNTVEGRANNRRVEIIVQSHASDNGAQNPNDTTPSSPGLSKAPATPQR